MTQQNGPLTPTDVGANEWIINDDVLQLRDWGTHRVHAMPPAGAEVAIGIGATGGLRLVDPSRRTSREHARMSREHAGWMIRDLGRYGTRIDGSLRSVSPLTPGLEVGIGRITLIAESRALIALRNFLARLLGWSAERTAVLDRALRAVRLAATRRGPLIVSGAGDLVPIARSLHVRTLGSWRPFVVCDPRRRQLAEGAPASEGQSEGLAAMKAAAGGTLCVRTRRLPPDFDEVSLALRDPASRVRLVMCTDEDADSRAVLADPIVIPPLTRRRAELGRIIEEYARDAVASLAAGPGGFTRADHAWVLEHSAASLPDIEKATRRLVAIRQTGSLTRAAARLGMSHVALAQWIGRRRLP